MKALGNKEVEVKLRVADLAAFRRRLARLGMRRAARGRVHERNTLYDTPQGGLAKHGQLLRVRQEERSGKATRASGTGNLRAVLTYKGPALPVTSVGTAQDKPSDTAQERRYKVRQEIEVGVAEPEQLRLILEALGLRGWFRYEKYRTSYQLPASFRWAAGLQVELDETPIGVFVELEGPPRAIDRVASQLGYAPADYITKSYLALYLDQCRKRGVPPGDMVFPPGGK